MASPSADPRPFGSVVSRVSKVAMTAVGPASNLGSKVRRIAGRVRRQLVPAALQGVPVEIVMDAGAYLNWRSTHEITALVLTPEDSSGIRLTSEGRDEPGPPHGLVDLRDLMPVAYQLSVRTSDGMRPVALVTSNQPAPTLNEGWIDGARWKLDDDHAGAAILCREAPETRPPQIVSVGCALGIVSLTVGPAPADDWSIELRKRGSANRVICGAATSGADGVRTFRFSARHWDEAGLPPDAEVTRWDAWAVRQSSPGGEVRLRWGGSSSADPRVSQRLRASVSRPWPGSVTRVRPYWTLDQFLSVEISRLNDLEGMQE